MHNTFNKLKIEIGQTSCSLIFYRRCCCFFHSLTPSTLLHIVSFLISNKTNAKILFHLFHFSLLRFYHAQNLERKEKHQATQLEQLSKKQIFLKWRCEQLISYNEALCKRRSVSECSTSTISSTNSYELTRSSSSICESGAFVFSRIFWII